MKLASHPKAVGALLSVGLLASCAPAEAPDVVQIDEAVLSNDAINFATALFKKLDPNQNLDSPVGPFDETGFRPGGRDALVGFMSHVLESLNYANGCWVINSFHIDEYFTPEASRARQNWEREWQMLVEKTHCDASGWWVCAGADHTCPSFDDAAVVGTTIRCAGLECSPKCLQVQAGGVVTFWSFEGAPEEQFCGPTAMIFEPSGFDATVVLGAEGTYGYRGYSVGFIRVVP